MQFTHTKKSILNIRINQSSTSYLKSSDCEEGTQKLTWENEKSIFLDN